MRHRTTGLWIATAVIVAVVVAAIALLVMRSDDSTDAADCDIVSALFAEWNDTVGGAETAIKSGKGGRDGALALADAESDMATRIRASHGDVDSPAMAGDLERWASGAEQIAQSRRDQVNNPNRSITDPAPRGYAEGSLSTQTAIASLVEACPEARQPNTNA